MTDERETLVPCPRCEGAGFLRRQDGPVHHGWTCELCRGDKAVSVAVARAWRLGERAGRVT